MRNLKRIATTMAAIALSVCLIGHASAAAPYIEVDVATPIKKMIEPGQPAVLSIPVAVRVVGAEENWNGTLLIDSVSVVDPDKKLKFNPFRFTEKSEVDATNLAAVLEFELVGLSTPGKYMLDIKVKSEEVSPQFEGQGKLEVFLGFKPTLNITNLPTDEKIELNVATCGNACFLSHLFYPKLAQTEYTLQLRNDNEFPVILDARVIEDGLSYPGSASVLSLAVEGGVEEAGENASHAIRREIENGEFALTVSLDELVAAGTTNGKVHLTLSQAEVGPIYENQDVVNRSEKEIGYTINARDGVVWALLVVFAGVVVGRIGAQSLKVTEARLDAYGRSLNLRDQIEAIFDPKLRSSIESRINDLIRRIDMRGETDANLTTDVDNLEQTVLLSMKHTDLQKIWASLDDGDSQKPLMAAALERAVAFLIEKDLENARASLHNAAILFNESPPAATDALGQRSMVSVSGLTEPAKTKLDRAAGLLSSSLNFLAGTKQLSVGTWYSTLRPLLFLILLVVLTVYGVWEFYVDDGQSAATLGAGGWPQYTTLFLWGISAEVVAKTLQSINFGKQS